VKQKIRVGVIFGGRSGEHEVSLASARSVMAALDRDKYEVIPIGITREGQWLTSGDPMAELLRRVDVSFLPGPEAAPEPGAEPEVPAAPLSPDRRELITGTRESGIPQLDVIFPVLHGPYGEDGTVQGLLELADLPYVGAGVLGSALGMDKITQKTVLRAHGLPVAAFLPVKRAIWERGPAAIVERVEIALGYPCFVKPANLGSSVGITKVHNRAQLLEGLRQAARYDRKMLVEEAIVGREIEVSVLGNDDPIASVPGEVIPSREFYDYAAKYLDDASELIIPADLPPKTAELIQYLAVSAFLALDCAGMARADFFLEEETGKPYVNELNTIPGFTKISMYPKLWEASGLAYPALLDRLIELALERYEDNRRREITYSYPSAAADED
jgi:D-alanine-D-alanine ligase